MMEILKALQNVRVTKLIICWIAEVDVKARDHCQVTGKYRGAGTRDCNINLSPN